MKYLVLLLLSTCATPALAQNCQPIPAAVEWLSDFTAKPGCYRIADYIFGEETWYCPGSPWILSFPRGWTGRYDTTARKYYFVWSGLWDYYRIPTDTLFCRCNVESCEVREWR